MRDYISENYDRLHNLALIITNNKKVIADDLMQETCLSVLERKSPIPRKIFDQGKEFLFLYVIMKRTYFHKNSKYNRRYDFQKSENIISRKEKDTFDEMYLLRENNEFEKEQYKQIKIHIENKIKTKEIFWFNGRLFLMYYYPSSFFGIECEKISYRELAIITGINYQAIRLAVINVKLYLKKQMVKN